VNGFHAELVAKLEYKFVDLDSGGVTGAYTGYNYGYHDHPQFNVVALA